MNDQTLVCESLQLTLAIMEKCLSYDFSAVLLNDTMDEPMSTNIPSNFRPMIEDPSTC